MAEGEQTVSGCLCHGANRADPLADGCTCSGCETLRAEMAVDPPVDPHYGCHLLIKGWAGTPLSRGERAYRLAHMPAARSSQARGYQNARFLVHQRQTVGFEAEKVSPRMVGPERRHRRQPVPAGDAGLERQPEDKRA